jgi:hypothetical protein
VWFSLVGCHGDWHIVAEGVGWALFVQCTYFTFTEWNLPLLVNDRTESSFVLNWHLTQREKDVPTRRILLFNPERVFVRRWQLFCIEEWGIGIFEFLLLIDIWRSKDLQWGENAVRGITSDEEKSFLLLNKLIKISPLTNKMWLNLYHGYDTQFARNRPLER